MSTLTLELILWMLLAFFVGCIIGCILYSIFAGTRRRALDMAAAEAAPGPHQWVHSRVEHAGSVAPPPSAPRPAPAPGARAEASAAAKAAAAAAPQPQAPAPAPTAATGKPRPPQGLSHPPEGGGDKLQRISGVGPRTERTLHRLGVYQYRQIAAWTADEVEWVDEHLKFRGRIAREEWIVQARLLQSGDEEAFARQFGSGGLKDKSGKVYSGSRTRRS